MSATVVLPKDKLGNCLSITGKMTAIWRKYFSAKVEFNQFD